jgi:hypothetical protein
MIEANGREKGGCFDQTSSHRLALWSSQAGFEKAAVDDDGSRLN